MDPPAGFDRYQEEFDLDFVYHEELVPLTNSRVSYFRVSEPLKGRLRAHVNDSSGNLLGVFGKFEVSPANIKKITHLILRQG